MQSFTQIPDTLSLTASRLPLLDNDRSVASMFSGTAFPTADLVLEMWCYRTDLRQLFQLTALTPVWTMRFDLNTGAQFQPPLTLTGTATAYVATPTWPLVVYVADLSFVFKFNVASGAAPTLQISGLATPPNLVKRLGDGSFANIALNDIPAGLISKCSLISPTQLWVEQLPLTAVASGGTGANTPGGARTALGAAALGDNTDLLSVAPTTKVGVAGPVVGYRDVPIKTIVVDTTLALADAANSILHPSADTTARTVTIPANAAVAFPIGTAISFVNQNAAGVMSIAITADTMRLAGAGTTGTRALAANGMATALKLTATEWIISGAGLT